MALLTDASLLRSPIGFQLALALCEPHAYLPAGGGGDEGHTCKVILVSEAGHPVVVALPQIPLATAVTTTTWSWLPLAVRDGCVPTRIAMSEAELFLQMAVASCGDAQGIVREIANFGSSIPHGPLPADVAVGGLMLVLAWLVSLEEEDRNLGHSDWRRRRDEGRLRDDGDDGLHRRHTSVPFHHLDATASNAEAEDGDATPPPPHAGLSGAHCHALLQLCLHGGASLPWMMSWYDDDSRQRGAAPPPSSSGGPVAPQQVWVDFMATVAGRAPPASNLNQHCGDACGALFSLPHGDVVERSRQPTIDDIIHTTKALHLQDCESKQRACLASECALGWRRTLCDVHLTLAVQDYSLRRLVDTLYCRSHRLFSVEGSTAADADQSPDDEFVFIDSPVDEGEGEDDEEEEEPASQ